jgi:ankyrin repeat protein
MISAVKNNSHNIMKSLIEKDPKSALIKNMHGYTPLHIAAEEGNLPAVIALCRMAPQSATRQVIFL